MIKIKRMFLLALPLLLSCKSGDNNTTTSANKNTTAETQTQTDANTSTNAVNHGDDIVGEWEQQYTCFDKNGNYKLEPEEKKPSNTRVGYDWFSFNADGSCLRDKEVKFKSTYEIQNRGNTKELIIHNVHDFTIIELTDKELILGELIFGGEGAFIVFKKIK